MKHMISFITFAVIAYGGVCALLFFLQEKMLFFPHPANPQAIMTMAQWHRSIEAPGATLSGWLVPARNPRNSPLVLYFGGNAEDVSLSYRAFGAQINLVLMNYRGYGASEGEPSEKVLFADALLIHDTLIESEHNGKVVVFGRSLGSGIAVYLASQRKVDAIVLVAPYDSIRNVAQRHYPWLPISFLLTHPFDSLALAPGLVVPALFLVAQHDEIIPPAHAQNLYEKWGGSKSWVLVENATHNSISEQTGYRDAIDEFLRAP